MFSAKEAELSFYLNKAGMFMISFVSALMLLIVGYFVYGKIVEKIFKPSLRQTPAVKNPDGVDYIPMKTGKLFLSSC